MFLPNMQGLNFWKIKKDKPVINAFMKIVSESNREPNKLQPDQETKFYNRLM